MIRGRNLSGWKEDRDAFEAEFERDMMTQGTTPNYNTTPAPTGAPWSGWSMPALPSLDTITAWAKANQTAVVAGAATLFLLALLKRR